MLAPMEIPFPREGCQAPETLAELPELHSYNGKPFLVNAQRVGIGPCTGTAPLLAAWVSLTGILVVTGVTLETSLLLLGTALESGPISSQAWAQGGHSPRGLGSMCQLLSSCPVALLSLIWHL